MLYRILLLGLVTLVSSCAGSPVLVPNDPELSSVLPKDMALAFMQEIQKNNSSHVRKCEYFDNYVRGWSYGSYTDRANTSLTYKFRPTGGSLDIWIFDPEGYHCISALPGDSPEIPVAQKAAVALEALGLQN